MGVRAKFTVTEIRHIAHQPDGDKTIIVSAMPACCNRPPHATPEEEDACESHGYSKWTPAGKLELTITNPRAFGAFVEGHSYYLDFTPAD